MKAGVLPWQKGTYKRAMDTTGGHTDVELNRGFKICSFGQGHK